MAVSMATQASWQENMGKSEAGWQIEIDAGEMDISIPITEEGPPQYSTGNL